jgi:hypothetical protein
MARGRSNIQTVSLGAVGNFGTMLEAVSNDGPWEGQLGMEVQVDNKTWKLVKLDYDIAAIDGLDGGLAYWEDQDAFVISFDASGAEAGANSLAGGVHQAIDVSALTEDQYMWIQVGGEQAAVVVAASAVAGDQGTGHASTDNVLTRTAAGTAAPDRHAAIILSTRGSTTSDEGAAVANSSRVRWLLGNSQ